MLLSANIKLCNKQFLPLAVSAGILGAVEVLFIVKVLGIFGELVTMLARPLEYVLLPLLLVGLLSKSGIIGISIMFI